MNDAMKQNIRGKVNSYIKRAEEIKNNREINAGNVLAITDTVDGHRYSQSQGIEDLCTALVYDAETDFVLNLLKGGNSPKDIQQWYDYRWGFPSEQAANDVVPELIFDSRLEKSK